MQTVTHRSLPEAIASVLTSQPREINRHIDEPLNFIQSFDFEDSEINENVLETNLWSPNSPSIQMRDHWIHCSPKQLVSQTSCLACQATEISVDIPSIPHLSSLIVRIPKRSGSPVETQSTPKRTKRRQTLFMSTS